MAVEQRGVQALFQRPNLAGDGRLAEVQGIARMRQAASIGDCVKYS